MSTFAPGCGAKLPATTSSANVELPHDSSNQVLFWNAGSVPVHVAFGPDSTATAAVPGSAFGGQSTPIAPGAVMVLQRGGSKFLAFIAEGGSASLYATAGSGE